MQLSDANIQTVMLALHQKIEAYADYTADQLSDGGMEELLTYPPNCGLAVNERQALDKLKNDPVLKSALRKVLANNSAGVVFELLNYIDGTTDPDEDLGDWTEVSLVDKTVDMEPPNYSLHNTFFSTYWDWKQMRPDLGWTLDTEAS